MSEKELRKEISIRFKKMRKALDISQEKLGTHLGVARPSYTNYESGYTFPGLEALGVLANNFDVSLDWLIANKGPMFYKGKGKLRQQEENGLAELPGDMKELFDLMVRVPLLHYQMMTHFLIFKRDYPDIIDTGKNKEDKDKD